MTSKWLCFVMFDKKVARYERPFYATHAAEVTRSLVKHMPAKETNFAQFPGDFALFMIGEFDSNTGELHAYPQPVHIIEVAALANGGSNE